MKKTNKLSETSKKTIRYLALTAGLMTATLPNKAKAGLFNFNVDANVGSLAGVKAGVNIGNGVNVYAGANALGIGGSTGVSVGSTTPVTTYAAPKYDVVRGYSTTTPTQPVSYATTAVVQPEVRYVTMRPAPVVYQTAPVVQSGNVVVKESYDASSLHTPDTDFSHEVYQYSEENPVQNYRLNKVSSRKVTVKKQVYYTYE